MDFTLTESQRACVESAGAFADLALKPHAAHWDREHESPIPTIKQAAALGLLRGDRPGRGAAWR